MLKFFDIAEGVYNDMTLEDFSKMRFYEPKVLTKEVLEERFKNST